MIDRRAVARGVALIALPLILGACAGAGDEWLTDMKQQPSVGTWQKFSSDSLLGETTPFRANPQGSVPITGSTVAAWQVSYTPGFAQLDSLATIENPVAADERSLVNGRKLFQINCAVCHGVAGDADGAMRQLNPAYGFMPSIVGPTTVARTDGYIWGMMRNGRGIMPTQNRIPDAQRWDVVNYLRGLQGRYPVPVGPVGFPGETGTALPEFSEVGPMALSAFRRPSMEHLTPKIEKATETGKTEAAKTPGGHE